jgi:hypothetical protein
MTVASITIDVSPPLSPICKLAPRPRQLTTGKQPPRPPLQPPFSKSSSIKTSTITLPALIPDGESTVQPRRDTPRYLGRELKTPKLDEIFDYLWLAGLPRGARPLHRQVLLGRKLLVTEDVNEHLVWTEERFFVKPLPAFLLDYDFWGEHLCGDDHELHKSACGLLLSYAWLVCYESDLLVAKDLALLPRGIEWRQWTSFIEAFLGQIDPDSLEGISNRYRYGELRLGRLNSIYRLTAPSSKWLAHSYMSTSTWERSFFTRNFAWLLVVFAYTSVLLGALQVGLARDSQDPSRKYFELGSYPTATICIFVVGASVVGIFLTWLFLFFHDLSSTWQGNRRVSRK